MRIITGNLIIEYGNQLIKSAIKKRNKSMREIKFRAWDGESMLKSWDLEWLKENAKTPDDFNQQALFNPNCIFMQYTGLEDKNGKEIYEGDIVKVPWHIEGDTEYEESIAEVYFNEDEAEFQIDGKKCGYISMFDFVNNWEGEVIGNIYENPELIK